MHLSVSKVKQAKTLEKPYKLYDANNMYVLVHPNGSKYWRFDYRFNGKRKTLSMGLYPEVSLAEAREKVDAARILLRKGNEPSLKKKRSKKLQLLENTFRAVALDWFYKKMHIFSGRHRQRAVSIFNRDLFPVIFDRQDVGG